MWVLLWFPFKRILVSTLVLSFFGFPLGFKWVSFGCPFGFVGGFSSVSPRFPFGFPLVSLPEKAKLYFMLSHFKHRFWAIVG